MLVRQRRILWPALVLLALATCAVCGTWLFRALQREERLRVDPFELAHYAGDQPSARRPGHTRVVLFGDSRARSWPDHTHRGFELINRGIGYQTTRQVLGRFERDLAAWQPQVVVLQLGVNDLKATSQWPERATFIVSECKRNINELVTRSVGLGAHVVITTIFSLGAIPWFRMLMLSPAVGARIADVNRYLVTLRSEHVTVLDSAAILDGPDGKIRPEYQADFLHLNNRGYDVLDEQLDKVLRGLPL
ncbi:MAG: GDSL-type esterase/lipase family protein [Polyangiales bacterium]